MSGTRNFKNFIDGFMEYVDYVEAPDKFLRWSALSIVAGALERKVWITNGAATWYPNLYIMLVGDAGSRKSTSSEIAVDLLRELHPISFLAERLNEASLIAKLLSTSKDKRFILAGNEYAHSAVFLYGSEAATSFSEMYKGASIIVTLTDLFNCGPRGWHKHHAWTKHTLKDGEVKIFNPCINVLACSTPAWLMTKVMTQTDAEGGFGSRLILVVHKGEYRKDFAWRQANVKQIHLKQLLVKDLRQIYKMQGEFRLEPSFTHGVEKYDRLHSKWLLERKETTMVSGYQERKLTHAIKLSQVLAASQSDDRVVTGDHIDEAWELLTSLESDMLTAFGQANKTPEMSNFDLLWEYLERTQVKRFIKSEMVAQFCDRMSVRDVGIAIKGLQDAGRVVFLPRESAMGRLVFAVIRGNVSPISVAFSAPEQSPGSM